MKKSFFIALSVLSLSLLTSACGGGSNGLALPDSGGTSRCPETYNPIPLDLDESDKVSKIRWPDVVGAEQPLPSGAYEYSQIDFYIVDTRTDFRLHVREIPGTEKSTLQNICARNALAAEALMVETEFPAALNAFENGKVTSENKVITIEINDRAAVKVTPESSTPANPPSKVTEEQNYQSKLYKKSQATNDELTYELHLQDLSGPVHRYALIRYKKTGEQP